MPDDPPGSPASSLYEPADPERPATAVPTEPLLEQEVAAAQRDPYEVLRIPDARRFLMGDLLSNLGTQMLTLAIGWEIYDRTSSPTALGLVGLVQALPIIFLAMPAGHVADSFNRKKIVMWTQACIAFCSLAMAATSFWHNRIPNLPILQHTNAWLGRMDLWLQSLFGQPSDSHFDQPVIPLMYLILLLNGVARCFNWPAKSSLLPRLVPMALVPSVVTWSSSSFQTAAVVGPAAGGFLAALSYPLVYAIDAVGHCFLIAFMLGIHPPPQPKPAEKLNIKTLLAGLRFVFEKQVILATITLDLFAVLLGGAVALLPVYAKLLSVGPIGLGFLRAAPSVGALLMGLYLAHRPPLRHAGRSLLWAVAGFGAATIIFGITALLPGAVRPTLGFLLALAALFVTGVLDNISVVVRHSLVQLLTPDAMRGRVSAVNNVFIGSSNELGAFESGITAAMFGPVISVVGGGIGTMLVVLLVALFWSEVRRIGSLQDVHA